ncbi:MAG: hypothetical protein ACK5KL_01235 [Dysgonomonas sp.]
MENINLIEIKELIINTEKSKIYKSGLITDTYNKIFNKNEKTTNCGSCLRTFFLKIKNWYQEELKKQMEAEVSPILSDNVIEPVTLEQVRGEITIINDAIRNDRLVEVIEDKPKSKGKKKK